MVVRVNDQTVDVFLATGRAVLVLTRTHCDGCEVYRHEIKRLLQHGELAGVRVGELVLNRSGSSRFKQANPWVERLEVLPYTVLYRDGERVEDFAVVDGSYLLHRVRFALVDAPHRDADTSRRCSAHVVGKEFFPS